MDLWTGLCAAVVFLSIGLAAVWRYLDVDAASDRARKAAAAGGPDTRDYVGVAKDEGVEMVALDEEVLSGTGEEEEVVGV